MTGNEMLTSLGYRMEDTGHTDFPSAQKLVALNDAQRQVVALCSNEALVQTQVRDDLDSGTEDASFGGHTYFALPADGDGAEKLMNRVIKAYDNTNERFIEMVSPNGFETTNKYNYGTLGTLLNNRLYVSTNDTEVDSVFMVHIPAPADIAANDTEITHFSESVQQAIVEMAESLLWRQDNRQQRAQGASSNAIAMITAINASV
jgi:hypothetical protein